MSFLNILLNTMFIVVNNTENMPEHVWHQWDSNQGPLNDLTIGIWADVHHPDHSATQKVIDELTLCAYITLQ